MPTKTLVLDKVEPFDEPVSFGKYELLEQLAIGGMAEIFIARSVSLGGVARTCVIKRILPQHCANRQFISMFIDEARIMIGLEHPNVVKLYDFGQVDGSYYMAIEYVSGFDLVAVLSEVARAGGAIPPLASAFMLHAMAGALDHAHALKDHSGRTLGVVHRDVSPHNVLLSFEGDVKLTDFGIARVKNKLTRTMPGTVMGKFAYMSPEQALAEPVDARSDLFSAGVVLYELLTGQRLFAAKTPIETITKVLEKKVEPPSSLRPEVPAALDRVVRKALRRSLHKRYQRGRDMAGDLALYLDKHRYDQDAFAAYLAQLNVTRDKAASGSYRSPSVRSASMRITPDEDEVIVDLKTSLVRDPNLWTLANIGERMLSLGERVRAMATLRTAAAVFAHRGLMVQAVVALEPIRHLCDEGQRHVDLVRLAELRSGDREALRHHVNALDGGGAFGLLQQSGARDLDDDAAESAVLPAPAPLLGTVEPEQFASLVSAARVRHLNAGERVVVEGDGGQALYGIGRGRVVVYCTPPADRPDLGDDGRIYLSSLSEGDFFGEFSFLTGRPRTATVETITDAWLLELDRAAADSLVGLDSENAGLLLDFYKERVAELQMAKSPVFAVLEPHQRKVLLAGAVLKAFADTEVIVREGEASDALYFIKNGEVEVFTERDGLPIFLNKLAEGDFFGEISAIQGVPRTASVRAIADVEVLRIEALAIQELIDVEPRLSAGLQVSARERSDESEQLIEENLDLLRRL